MRRRKARAKRKGRKVSGQLWRWYLSGALKITSVIA